MAFSVQEKAEVVSEYALHPGDTGSAAVQVALITKRLSQLQKHFAEHKKDHHSRRGLLKMVGRRRRLLDYLCRNDIEQYRALIAKLGLRK